MEKFVVSARKYRPQSFASVVGQEHITTTLKNAIRNNQLAHAFLFCGPRGVGKTTCARILAKTINCENRTPEGEACNACPSCVSFNNGTSLNIHELDAASNNSVEDIRALVDQVRFAPQAGKYKVYIVDEVHMLSSSAFNAFLKTLEEPPSYAIFILATTEKHKIIPTILSRCQIFDFKRMTNADTVAHLKDISEKEGIKADPRALHLISRKGEGCMRDALSLFDKIVSFTNRDVTYENTLLHLNILDEDYYFRLLDSMQQQKLSDVLLIFDEINRKGFESDVFLNGFSEFLRNLFVSKDARVVRLLEVAEDFKPKYMKAAENTSHSWLISALNILSEAEVGLRQSRNKRLNTELLLIRLSYLKQAIEFSSDGGIKKKTDDAVKSVSFKALTPIRISEKKNAPTGENRGVKEKNNPARLLIETPLPQTTGKEVLSRPKVRKRVKSLSEIRKTVIEKQHKLSSIRLDSEQLHQCWEKYIEKLRREGHQSSVDSFIDAKLNILDGGRIDVVVKSDYQLHFIESERAALIGHLQGWFNDRMLTYSVRMDSGVQEEEKEEYLNNREKYLKMIKQYPDVQKLKERLGLKLEL